MNAVNGWINPWVGIEDREPDTDRLVWVMRRYGELDNEFAKYESTWGYFRNGAWYASSYGQIDPDEYVKFWAEAPAPIAYPEGYEAKLAKGELK